MKIQSCALSKIMNGIHSGSDVFIDGICTDTRSLKKGDLFFALSGPNFDGHYFIDEAIKQGAIAAVVSKNTTAAITTIKVNDVKHALGDMAGYWRSRFTSPVVAITGSNGKTTVKEMIAAIMIQRGRALSTQGNFNNEIGVPLTLLRILPDEDQFAVIEMGANHVGEIAYLTHLACPDVAIVTNVSDAHLEGFGSRDNIAQAKSEIFLGLREHGVAVINADDQYVDVFKKKAAAYKTLTFGFAPNANIRATNVTTLSHDADNTFGTHVELETPIGEMQFNLSLPGHHNVMNALAATTACTALNFSVENIVQGLQSMGAVTGRLEMKTGINGIRLIDDTYNANPASFRAAIAVLASGKGHKIIVIGDMAELGKETQDLHRTVGTMAKEAHIDALYAVGDSGKVTAESFGSGGACFATQEELVSALKNDIKVRALEDVTVLVKGSRSSRMEKVIHALMVSDDSAMGSDRNFVLQSAVGRR
ncbi:UDP-N-acetylmuramoyl-tripeptide--D-alanyl-D-alanine ligase [hydrothermal vent metagenome]|uniref:UDP-MurNAc-pentapeptide synthetase n=1 Tax=hydrothermal vent metagenome TaxID=652676 RepID=A0A3B0ZG75_9ZZZZ